MQTKNKTITDLLRWEVDPNFCRREAVLRNTTGNAVALANPIGYPVVASGAKFVLAQAGDESASGDGIAGILITERGDIASVANNTDYPGKYAFLVTGPATISKAGLHTEDVEGNDFDMDDLIAALALLDIKVDTEPTVTSTQTT